MSTTKEIGRNVLVLAAAYAALFLTIRMAEKLSPGWMLEDVASVGVLLAALAAAVVLRTRPAAYVTAAFAAFEVSELVFHSLYGIRSVQSGPVHFAVLAAGAMGIALGAFIRSDPKMALRRSADEHESSATAG
jgi:hypothetical protein